jgi:hypothetical protein
VAKVGTSIAGGTISQQAAVHPWLAADAMETKTQVLYAYNCETVLPINEATDLRDRAPQILYRFRINFN